nr:immunoglobulin light chain junction region [Macaca mulatta]MOY11369.1 immunoglobulin light chain junction region [Macaca mulatta]MOY11765.1 immunoglobulin light chain junction region [Macaca mulatta]MOY11773.1 immunoglobulin light chain junction region [Macaca mulatta]MOY11856.1 immunoglobulin light chain junction region [Macaca mulatta]
CLQGYNTPLTF